MTLETIFKNYQDSLKNEIQIRYERMHNSSTIGKKYHQFIINRLMNTETFIALVLMRIK